MEIKVKICGVTNLEDASFAAEAGAWAVGMVMYPPSPRACAFESAVAIGGALKRRCELVGVFVNEDVDQIARAVEQCSLTVVQLHGDEGPAFCLEVQRKTGAKVIKAVRVKDGSSIQAAEAFNADYFLFDSFNPKLYGGTGGAFNWEFAARYSGPVPVILSGGLNPDNVGEAVSAVNPYAVDVASGTESGPGKKDPAKVGAFIEAAREASAELKTEAEELVEHD